MNTNKYQVTFDLHTSKEYEKILREKYNRSLSSMYSIIKQHFLKNNFSWIEGSSYQSNEAISINKLNTILKKLYYENLWLSFFTKDLKRTVIIEKDFNYNEIIKDYQNLLEIEENKQLQQNEQECDDLEL